MKNGSKLWIVSELYYPTLISTGYYVTEIAEYIAKWYPKVNVICSNSSYNIKDNTIFSKTENHNMVQIFRVKSQRRFNKNIFFQRFLSLTILSVKFSFKILSKVQKNDKLIVLTNPAFLIVFVNIISKIKGFKYTILVHDLFPENLIPAGVINKGSFIFKCLQFIFKKSYANAEKIIAIGRDMQNVLIKKVKQTNQVLLLTNWAEDRTVSPVPKTRTETFKRLPKHKIVIQFAGNLGRVQWIDNLLKAIEATKNPNLHFVFIGSGTKEGNIKKFISDGRSNNISYLGFISREKQNDFLNACDVALVTLCNGMYGLGVPSKSYNIMAAGKPLIVVADKNSEISLSVAEEDMGWVIEPNNYRKLANLLDRIATQGSEIKRKGINARNAAVTRFAKERILKQYYQCLLSGPNK